VIGSAVRSPSFHIAVRFLLAHKRSLGLSALGVIFGVGAFIAACAQTQGFEKFYIQTVLGSEGSLVITDRFREQDTHLLAPKPGESLLVSSQQNKKFYPGIEDAYHIIDVLSTYPQVVACSPIVEGRTFIRSGFDEEAVSLQGIDLELHLRTTDFGKQVSKGSMDDFRNDPYGACIGEVLAERMNLSAGQYVFIRGPNNETRRFRIDVIYETGVWDFDIKNVFVHLRTAQSILQEPYFVSFMLVKLVDPSRAPEMAEEFKDLLSHQAASWQERQAGNLHLFDALRISAGIVVSMIILLSGFGIFNVLSLSVMQRTKEIAILRSMGYDRADIAAIFLWQGACVAVVGIVFGWGLGALLTFVISKIPVNFRGILRTDYFLVDWSVYHYLIAALLAAIAVFIASYVPARRASRLEPVDTLRGTGQ
jgi:lipoprotein-releasing system permease protein